MMFVCDCNFEFAKWNYLPSSTECAWIILFDQEFYMTMYQNS